MALYNQIQFNSAQFDGFYLNDSITVTDNTVNKDITRDLTESITLSESLTKQITNKVLSDTIRTGEWLQSERSPGQIDWHD